MGPVRLLDEEQNLSPALLKLLRATLQKRMSSIISYANFVVRQLQRSGIHGTIQHTLEPLPYGYAVTIVFQLVSVDEDVIKHHRRQLYASSFDYKGPTRQFKQAERLIEEGSEDEDEVEEGERGAEGTPAEEGLGGSEAESREGEDNDRGAAPPSDREGSNGGEGGVNGSG